MEDDNAADHDSGVIILVASLEKATEASDMVMLSTFVRRREGGRGAVF